VKTRQFTDICYYCKLLRNSGVITADERTVRSMSQDGWSQSLTHGQL